MAQLRREYEQFTQRGAEILNLGPDSGAAFRSYWREHNLPFPGLADPKHIVAKQYQQPFRLLRLGRMPMTLVVDREGVLRYRHDGGSMRDIPASSELFPLLDKYAEA